MNKNKKLPIITHLHAIVNCPYCKHVVKINYPIEDYKIDDVILCDPEDGGCDEYFVIFSPYEVTYEVLSVRGLEREDKADG